MNHYAAINSLASTTSLLLQILGEYKSTSARKAFLTRERNALQQHINEVSAAVSRNDSSAGWLLGERYSTAHISAYNKELNLLDKLYAEISTIEEFLELKAKLFPDSSSFVLVPEDRGDVGRYNELFSQIFSFT